MIIDWNRHIAWLIIYKNNNKNRYIKNRDGKNVELKAIKYRKIEDSEMPHIFIEILVLFIICRKCEHNNNKSVEKVLLKVLEKFNDMKEALKNLDDR